jgi:predicted PurR-regulated permease PerM
MAKASFPGRPFVLLFSAAVIVAGLHYGRPLLAPLAVAVLLTFLLAPAVDWMQRRWLPGAAPVVLVMLAAVGVVAGVGALVVGQSRALVEQLPAYESNIRDKLTVLRDASRHPISPQAQRTLEELGDALETAPEAARTAMAVTVVDPEGGMLDGISPLLSPLTTAGLTLMLAFFMLLQRRMLRDRLVHLFGRRNLGMTTRALDEAGRRISRYLRAQGLINLGFGTVIGVGLALIGVEFAALWGLLGALLRFIPYVGPWMAALMPTTLSLATSSGWTEPLLVLGLFAITELTINLALEPVLYGRSAGLSSLALVVTVTFWTLLWGPIGLFVATPLTACLCVLCRHVPDLGFIPLLLGDDEVATEDAKYFQRLLAHDEDEALQIALDHARAHPADETLDALLLPALSALKEDHRREGGGDDGTLAFGTLATRHIAEALDGLPASGSVSGNGAAHAGGAPAGERTAGGATLPVSAAIPDRADLPVVLACPASDELDVLAFELLRRMLQRDGLCELQVLGSNLLASEVMAHVARTRPALVCIGALSPGGLARARLLCRRLRAASPAVHIVVGRWRSEAPEADARLLQEAGADRTFTSLAEARQHLDSLSLIAKPA